MNFIYKLLAKAGTLIEGMIEAENKFDAAKKIREEGNNPVSIKEGSSINLVATLEKSVFRNFPELRLRIVDIY